MAKCHLIKAINFLLIVPVLLVTSSPYLTNRGLDEGNGTLEVDYIYKNSDRKYDSKVTNGTVSQSNQDFGISELKERLIIASGGNGNANTSISDVQIKIEVKDEIVGQSNESSTHAGHLAIELPELPKSKDGNPVDITALIDALLAQMNQ